MNHQLFHRLKRCIVYGRKTGQVDNIDERDSDDPLHVTEYTTDLYQYFCEKESSVLIRPTYIKSQPNINEKMCSILVDWLVEVHLKLKLVPETLYLTVNLIDRYLELQNVFRKTYNWLVLLVFQFHPNRKKCMLQYFVIFTYYV